LDALVTVFKAVGDPVRLRLFELLSLHDEVCVCHLVDALQIPQSTISRHLGILRHAGLVDTRREGKWMYYRLTGDLSLPLAGLLQCTQSDTLEQDANALKKVLAA